MTPRLPALLTLLVGCNFLQKPNVIMVSQPPGDSPDPSADVIEEVRSAAARETDPDVSETELAALVAGNNTFALDLYKQLRSGTQDEVFLSPYSLSVTLGMLYAGARFDTEAQMADALVYTLPQDRLHPAFNAMDLALDGRAEEARDADVVPTLNVVNALWGQTGQHFEDPWLDTLATHYDAGVYTLDLAGDPEGSRELINTWISDATEEKIPALLSPGAIDDATRLVLTNAILFKAAWDVPFETDDTTTAPFTLDDGTSVDVPMMHQSGSMRATVGEGYDAVELTYDGGMYAMFIVAPAPGTFSSFESSLTVEDYTLIYHRLDHTSVDLSMPKWDTSFLFLANDALGALGMTDAFDPGAADFSNVTGDIGLYIASVLHQAVITVDEAGTEAAAATAVIADSGAIGEEGVTIALDRPFLYAIVDRTTDAILFLGCVTDPS